MKTRIVIEISGGMLTNAWANTENIEIVLVDHDSGIVTEEAAPNPLYEFPAQDYLVYDGGYPLEWGRTRGDLDKTLREVKK